MRAEFISFNDVIILRKKVRKLVKHSSDVNYLNELQNLIRDIAYMTYGEMLNKFCVGLNSQLRLDVLKGGSGNVDVAVRIALNIYSDQFVAGISSSELKYFGSQPMDIRIIQGSP